MTTVLPVRRVPRVLPVPEGPAGPAGPSGSNARLAGFHGTAAVTAEDELQGAPANPKFLANIAIIGATADAAGLATVTFTVKDKDNTTPVTGLTVASAGIFKLAPKGNGLSYNKWVPYIYRPGRTVNAGYRESTATAGAKLTETASRDLHVHLCYQPVNGDSPLPRRGGIAHWL